MNTLNDTADQLLPQAQIRALVPVSDATIWRWEAQGKFPEHVSINKRNYWRRSDVIAWLNSHFAVVEDGNV